MTTYPESEYCTFLSEDGRRCRALKMPTRSVCIAHWKQDGQFEEDDATLAELANCSLSMDTTRGINRALRRLWRSYALGKVPHRKAALMAWMGQIMLCTMPRRGKEKDEPAPLGVPEPVADDLLPVPAELAAVQPGSNGSGGTSDAG